VFHRQHRYTFSDDLRRLWVMGDRRKENGTPTEEFYGALIEVLRALKASLDAIEMALGGVPESGRAEPAVLTLLPERSFEDDPRLG
jgi:hypothetical protein